MRRASQTESDAFAFLKADDEDCITYSGFCKALQHVSVYLNVSDNVISSLTKSHVKSCCILCSLI